MDSKDIQNFKELFEKRYGFIISEKEATRLAHKFIAFYKAVMTPNIQTSQKIDMYKKSKLVKK